jgi:hypothetical protein
VYLGLAGTLVCLVAHATDFPYLHPHGERVVIKGERITSHSQFPSFFGGAQPGLSEARNVQYGEEAMPTSVDSTGNEEDNNKKTCNPVAVATGEKLLAHTDFVHDSLLPLSGPRMPHGCVCERSPSSDRPHAL